MKVVSLSRSTGFTRCSSKPASGRNSRSVKQCGHPPIFRRCLAISLLANARRRAELAQERPRSDTGDGAEVRDQVGLIVVAGRGRDAGPAALRPSLCLAHRAIEASDPREGFRRYAEGLAEDAAEVSLAHAQAAGDGAHVLVVVRARAEEVGRLLGEGTGVDARRGAADARGERVIEDSRRRERVARAGQRLAQAIRRALAPQLFERDDAARDLRCGHAQRQLCRAQAKARRDRAAHAADVFAMYALARAARVDVDPALRRRPEAHHEVDLGPRQRDEQRFERRLGDDERLDDPCERWARRHSTMKRAAHGQTMTARERGASQRATLSASSNRMRDARDTPAVMNILVTGATGKVGSRLVQHLALRGGTVRALVRDPDKAASLPAAVERVKGDLVDPASLEAAVRGVDAVVHCAAFFRGATPEQAHQVNDAGTQHLGAAARAAGVKRFVFTSTGLVYGPTRGRPASEDDPCAPIAAYPASKLAAERALFAIEGLDVRVLRLPFVYGDRDPHIEDVVPMMRGFAPTQRMSIAHHADVAQAVQRILDAASPAHRIYNVVDDETPDLATLFTAVGAPPPDGSSAEAGRAFEAVLDGRRIREDLGFRPSFPRLNDAVARKAM
jgi:UDP-glucose 4-epimerase